MVEKCFCPHSVEEALQILAQYKSEISVCAGGTDLVVMMRKGKNDRKFIMDIGEIGLGYIKRDADSTIRIGATATITEVQNSPLLNGAAFRCLHESSAHVGSLQIRNVATAVGNICTGIPSADIATPLLALDARLIAASVRGERTIDINDFFEAPRKIRLASDELVKEIIIDDIGDAGAVQSRFRKVGPRRELVISIFNLAMLLQAAGNGTVCKARLAMGVVAPVPIRLKKTEAYIEGNELTPNVIEDALQIMHTEITPRTSLHASEQYRRLLAENILRGYLKEINALWKRGIVQ